MRELEQFKKKYIEELSKNLEFKNKLKEMEIEKHDLLKNFFLNIIKTIDMFESKDENLLEKYKEKNEDVVKVIHSYGIIKKQLITTLNKYGVTQLEFPENRLIVGFSKAIDTEPDDKKKNNTIISVVKNGYIKGSESIRDAELIVVKN